MKVEGENRSKGEEEKKRKEIAARGRRERERLHKTVKLDGRQEDEGLHAFFEALTNQPFLSIFIKNFLNPQWTSSSINPNEQKTKFRWLFECRMDDGGCGADG